MDRTEALDYIMQKEKVPKDQGELWWLKLSEDLKFCIAFEHLRPIFVKESNERKSEGGKQSRRGGYPKKYMDDMTSHQRNEKNKTPCRIAATVGVKAYPVKSCFTVYNKCPELIQLIRNGFLIKNRFLTVREAVKLVNEKSLKDRPIVEKGKLIPEAEKKVETYRLPRPHKDKLEKDKDKTKVRLIILKKNLPLVVVNEVGQYAINEKNQGRPVMVLVTVYSDSQQFEQHFEQEMGYCPIYEATNTAIECSDYGKSYIGSSELTLEKRKQNHFSAAFHSSNTPFSKAILEYGFNWRALAYTNNTKNLRDVESVFIECCDTRKNGYNEMA